MLDERDPLGWTSKALREAGSSLLSELYGLENEQLCWRPSPDEWSLLEVALHLRNNEELALAQLRALADGCPGALPAWDVEASADDRDEQDDDIEELLASLRSLRRDTTYLLWGLTEADWEQAAQHPYRGSVTLGQIARELAQHDLEHLWQVRRLKQQMIEAVVSPEED